MQVTLRAGEVFPHAWFAGEPGVFNGIESGRVKGQEFLGAAAPFHELAGFGRLLEAGIIRDHPLSWLEGRHQAVLDRGLEERGVAVALKHEGREERVAVEGIDQTAPRSALARLLAPARFALGTPPPLRPALLVGFVGTSWCGGHTFVF